MRTFTLAVLAGFVILLFAAGGVAAHDNGRNTTGHDDAPTNGTAADWAAWMEQHMGADAAAQMQEQMGMSYEEMGEHMASHQNGSMMHDRMMGGMMNGNMGGGMSGMGCH